MYKIGICGHFGGKEEFLDGQTVKTKSIYNELVKIYSKEEIVKVDTYKWKKNPLKLFLNCIKINRKCENIVLLPAHKGVKIFIPLFNKINKFFHKKIHYVIIGGWLPEVVKNDSKLKSELKKIDFIYAETNNMIKKLSSLGIENLYFFPNFKVLDIINITENKEEKNVKACIFSRIMKEKGIEDAIEIVNKINNSNTGKKLLLDIYGQIDNKYIQDFQNIIEKLPQEIKYKGRVDYNDSTKIISKYDFLLFPTKFKTEGIPGTIIDAYFSGVPVIASKWDNFDEVIIEGKTGLGYEIGNKKDFYNKLEYAITNIGKMREMKINCIEEAKKYAPNEAMKTFLEKING